MDTQQYIVKYGDRTTKEYFANVIAENLYSQIDNEGRQHMIFREITDHKKGPMAIEKEDGYYLTRAGNRHPKKTTRGWKLCVEWSDGSTDWIKLKDPQLQLSLNDGGSDS